MFGTPLSNAATQQFNDMFQNEYQGKGVLVSGPGGPTIEVIRGIVGESYRWTYNGPAVMEKRTAEKSEVPVSNTDISLPQANFETFALRLNVDVSTQQKVLPMQMQAQLRNHARSIHRREDQIVIDALDAGVVTNVVPVGGVGMTTDKIIEARTILANQNVPDNEMHLAMTPNQLRDLLKETQVTSDQFNQVKALVTGELTNWLGFTIHQIPEVRAEGGLPLAATTRSCFAWAQSSAGLAYGLIRGDTRFSNPGVIQYELPQNMTTDSQSILIAGATMLQETGGVKIECLEA